MKIKKNQYFFYWFIIVLFTLGSATPTPARHDFSRIQLLALERYGAAGEAEILAWIQLLRELVDKDIYNQISSINDFFNRRIIFAEDIDIWNVNDYWATPLETLGRRHGDCEDFAIAKYVSLRLLGVSDEKLRLIYVSARIGGMFSQVNQAHMVLGYYPQPESEPLILDNLLSEIRPASQRSDLLPVFSFNSNGLWVAGSGATATDSSSRLSRWRDVLARIQNDGLTLDPD